MNHHFLHDFLYPKSIAFYGANNKGTGIASFQVMNLILSKFKGNVYPIHLKLDSVMVYKAYKSISELPEVPDLVIIYLPVSKIGPQIFYTRMSIQNCECLKINFSYIITRNLIY